MFKRKIDTGVKTSSVDNMANNGTTEAQGASVVAGAQESKAKRIWRDNWEGWMFVLPLVIGLGLFTVYPMVQSLIMSFYNYKTFTAPFAVGFENYIDIFTGASSSGMGLDVFLQVMRNTSFYTFISVPITLITSYLIAILVNMKIKGVGFYRVVYYLPTVIPAFVSGFLWGDIFAVQGYNSQPVHGLFNTIITAFGSAPSEFFTSKSWGIAISSIFLMNLWSIGAGMILWLSAFKSIPGQLYEAAKIDGANRIQSFFHVTIPMSMSMIFFNVVTMIVGTFQYNGTMTFGSNSGAGEGPDRPLLMFGVYIYNKAFSGKVPFGGANLGYAAALSWVLLLFVGVITAVLFGLRRFLYMGDD